MNFVSALFLCFVVMVVGGSGSPRVGVGVSQDKHKKERGSKDQIGSGKEGRPVLWTPRDNLESLDLFYGPGGRDGAPDLSGTFTYIGPDNKGTQKKIFVKDGRGREWIVKFGPEARPETAATRIVWAMGYHTDQDYFVEKVRIEGMPGGDALNVRFKRRHYGFKDAGLWSWEKNPFVGTRELDGLKVLMVLLNNWDLKYSNNKVVRPDKKSRDDPAERIYYVGDLGATFGKTGSLAQELHFPHNPRAGTKDRPDQYASQSFIDGVHAGTVRFHYQGKDPGVLKGIPAANARWLGGMLARLSDAQLTQAFRAGGYNHSEVSILVQAIRKRITELQNVQ